MNKINAQTAAIFEQAEQVSVNLAEQLMMLGISNKAEARPYALAWAAAKYGVKVREGQRGAGFDRSTNKGEAAHKAVQRVLTFIYPASDLPRSNDKANQTDEVARLIKKFEGLTAAQKKRFLAGI